MLWGEDFPRISVITAGSNKHTLKSNILAGSYKHIKIQLITWILWSCMAIMFAHIIGSLALLRNNVLDLLHINLIQRDAQIKQVAGHIILNHFL